MGKKKSTTTQTNKPIYGRELMGANSDLVGAYNASKGNINKVSGDLTDLSSDLLTRFRDGDPTIGAARGYIEDTLGSDPTNNPYLDDMVAMTNDNIRNTLQARMGTRGQTGGSDYYGLIGREMGKNELGMRYADYDKAMGRKAQAAGMSPGIVAGDYIPVAAGMEAGRAGALLPIQAAAARAAGTGGLLGQYQTIKGTQKSGGGFMDILGMGLQAGSLFSDRRLKTDIKRVGKTDSGTPVYTYRYEGRGPFHMGVMADEVNAEALGPEIHGYATVRYEEVR